MADNKLDQFMRTILGAEGDDGVYNAEIPDERPAQIIDNGAFQEIADFAPVTPDEMIDTVDEPPAPQPMERDPASEVLGATDRRIIGARVLPPFRDDFLEKNRQFAKAAYGPNGEHLDDFDQKWQAQQRAHEELQAGAPFVRINPPSAKRGILGGSATVKSGDVPVQVASWIGDDDAEAQPVTVMANPTPYPMVTTSPGVLNTTRPYALVTFGTGINKATAEVDIGLGCQFTVIGSAVQVQVGMDANVGAVTVSPPATLSIGASLGFFQVNRTAPLTRTRYCVADAAGANVTVLVPPFAKRCWWMPWSAVGGPPAAWTWSFQDAYQYTSGLGVGLYTITTLAGQALATQMLTPIPLTPDIVAITSSLVLLPYQFVGWWVFELDL